MENAADALKMAFGVLMFIVALSFSISSFSSAKKAIDNITHYRDKTQTYIYVEEAKNNNRLVGIESIVPTMYKAYTENYRIEFYNENGEQICLYTKEDQYKNKEDVYYIDLEEEKFADINSAVKHLEALLSKKNLDEFKRTSTSGKTLYYEAFGENIGNEGLYQYLTKHKFEEHIGEYYQEDKSAGEETDALEINKTKKRVITYVLMNN